VERILEPYDVSAPEPAYSPEGVDLTMIRLMLSLTPAERLRALQKFVDSVRKIRARNTRV
jgi:hypothetical protein